MNAPNGDFEAYRAELEAAERKVAGEIDPGTRAVVVAVLVFVLLLSFLLPHTGSVNGIEILMGGEEARRAGVTAPSRLFCWLGLAFGVGVSMLALLTRRWTVAWLALAGSGLATATGMLAVWSRQTAAEQLPGPGIGLIIAWITLFLLTFHWARVVWTRTALQMAAEAQRRQDAAAGQGRSLLDGLDGLDGLDRPEAGQRPADDDEPPRTP